MVRPLSEDLLQGQSADRLAGVYTVLFAICTYILVYKKGKKAPLNRPMILATTVIFIMSTTHVIVDFVRGMKAFFDPSSTPIEYYAQIWDGVSIFKQALYATNKYALIVHRTFSSYSP